MDKRISYLLRLIFSLGGRNGAAVSQPVAFDFCRDLEALKSLSFALQRKCTLSERSEFGQLSLNH